MLYVVKVAFTGLGHMTHVTLYSRQVKREACQSPGIHLAHMPLSVLCSEEVIPQIAFQAYQMDLTAFSFNSLFL